MARLPKTSTFRRWWRKRQGYDFYYCIKCKQWRKLYGFKDAPSEKILTCPSCPHKQEALKWLGDSTSEFARQVSKRS